METSINNAIGLLEECLHNGDKGLVPLQGWFLGERSLIERTIEDLRELENEPKNPADQSWRCRKCGAYHYYGVWDGCQYCGESR